MQEIIFSAPALVIESVLFGFTMKVADLLDEHGLKWFKDSPLLFGILWGGFGSLLMFVGENLAIFLFALVVHWVLRYRIDYLNHGIAASGMLIIFIYLYPSLSFNWLFFLVVFVSFSVHGLFNDLVDRGKMNGLIAKYFQSNIHWIWIPLIFALYESRYVDVFIVSSLFIITYELTNHYGMQIVKQQNQDSLD